MHAREELGERERLRQIIVAACTKSAQALVQGRESAQNQDRCRLTKRSNRLDDRKALDFARQHPVEDHDIPALARREVQTIRAIATPGDHEPGLTKAGADVTGGIGVVLDQQTLHSAVPRELCASSARDAPGRNSCVREDDENNRSFIGLRDCGSPWKPLPPSRRAHNLPARPGAAGARTRVATKLLTTAVAFCDLVAPSPRATAVRTVAAGDSLCRLRARPEIRPLVFEGLCALSSPLKGDPRLSPSDWNQVLSNTLTQ